MTTRSQSCNEASCQLPTHARGFCQKHYSRDYHNRTKADRNGARRAYYEKNKAEMSRRHYEYRRTPAIRFKRAKESAKRRGKPFLLEREEYLHLISMPCFYCKGKFPPTETSIGLDRVNNDLGYVEGNCVSCCYQCNMIKGQFFSVEETLAAVSAILSVKEKRK